MWDIFSPRIQEKHMLGPDLGHLSHFGQFWACHKLRIFKKFLWIKKYNQYFWIEKKYFWEIVFWVIRTILENHVETIAAKKSNQNRYLGLIWAIVGHFGSFKAGKKIHIFHRTKNTISIRYFWIGKIIFHLFSYKKKETKNSYFEYKQL